MDRRLRVGMGVLLYLLLVRPLVVLSILAHGEWHLWCCFDVHKFCPVFFRMFCILVSSFLLFSLFFGLLLLSQLLSLPLFFFFPLALVFPDEQGLSNL